MFPWPLFEFSADLAVFFATLGLGKTRWATVDCCMLMISQLALDVDYDRRVMVISLSTDEKHEGQS